MRILGSIVAPSTTLVALRGPEIMGCGAIGPQLICDEPSGQGRGDRSAFFFFYNHQSLHATLRYPGAMAIAEQRLADQESSPHHRFSCGGAKRQQVQPMCFTKPVPPFIAASFVYKHAAYRSARHPLNPAGRHPGRAARMQISAGGQPLAARPGATLDLAVFDWVATLSKEVIRCRLRRSANRRC
jgi:hypothetical protein